MDPMDFPELFNSWYNNDADQAESEETLTARFQGGKRECEPQCTRDEETLPHLRQRSECLVGGGTI